MVNIEKNTELVILNAAKKVFHRKGFDGARMQEIAQEAGLNKALLHYYFRSKEKLFQAVFEHAFSEVFSKLHDVFHSDFTFASKIEVLVSYYISFLSENSYIPWFIINCIYEKPESLKHFVKTMNFTPGSILETISKQLKEEYGMEVDPLQVFLHVLSLCAFPVIAKPLLQHVFGLDPVQMNIFYDQRKKIVPTFIANALNGYEKNKNLV